MELVLETKPGVYKRAAASNRSACSMLLRPFPGPHHKVWYESEWSWRSITSEWQAYRVCKSFPHGYRNPVCTNRERDAGDCLLSWAFQPVHIWSHVHIRSDHKPLEMILQKPLARAPRRLQLMMMRLRKYDFTLDNEHSEDMHLADMLLKAYLPYKGKKWDDFEY